jgi:predicted PurR-regulated permease PerM
MLQPQSQSAYGSVTRWVLIAVLAVVLLLVAWAMRGILLLVLASLILVVLFSLPVRFLVRLGVSRRLATLLSVIFFIVVAAILSALTLPELIRQSYLLATVIIPQGVQALVERWASGDIQQQFPILQNITSQDIQNVLDTFGAQFVSSIGQIGSSVLPLVGGVADTFISILVIVFLSLYILADPSGYQEGMIRLFPIWYRGRVREILARLDRTMRGWLKATLFSMMFVGLATWIGLALIGIEQAAALGVLAGILSFIPNFGPIIALIPSVAVGIIQTPESIVWIIVIIYGVSFIQTQILIPLLVAGSIRLPAVLVLLGQILFGALLGFWGLMLAVPITAILMVFVQEVYIRDVLGDKTVVAQTLDEQIMPAETVGESKLAAKNA